MSLFQDCSFSEPSYGLTPFPFHELRLAKAGDLLASTNDRVIDIALASGFQSGSFFNLNETKELGTETLLPFDNRLNGLAGKSAPGFDRS